MYPLNDLILHAECTLSYYLLWMASMQMMTSSKTFNPIITVKLCIINVQNTQAFIYQSETLVWKLITNMAKLIYLIFKRTTHIYTISRF